jgi:hypothetical protein
VLGLHVNDTLQGVIVGALLAGFFGLAGIVVSNRAARKAAREGRLADQAERRRERRERNLLEVQDKASHLTEASAKLAVSNPSIEDRGEVFRTQLALYDAAARVGDEELERDVAAVWAFTNSLGEGNVDARNVNLDSLPFGALQLRVGELLRALDAEA